jgi:hypothetical protein
VVTRDWELADYDWCEDTGVATLTYERTREDTGEIQTKVVKKEQPSRPGHVGWRT